jgi:hypothetical protein
MARKKEDVDMDEDIRRDFEESITRDIEEGIAKMLKRELVEV